MSNDEDNEDKRSYSIIGILLSNDIGEEPQNSGINGIRTLVNLKNQKTGMNWTGLNN